MPFLYLIELQYLEKKMPFNYCKIILQQLSICLALKLKVSVTLQTTS
jgi:hypothetical protein